MWCFLSGLVTWEEQPAVCDTNVKWKVILHSFWLIRSKLESKWFMVVFFFPPQDGAICSSVWCTYVYTWSLVPTCDWVSYWPVKEARKSLRWCSRIPVLHWRTPLAFSELFSWSWPRRCSWLGSSSLFETPFTSTQPPWDLLRLRPCPLSLLTQDTMPDVSYN